MALAKISATTQFTILFVGMGSSRTTAGSLVDSSRVAIGDQLRQSRTWICADEDQAEVSSQPHVVVTYFIIPPTHDKEHSTWMPSHISNTEARVCVWRKGGQNGARQ